MGFDYKEFEYIAEYSHLRLALNSETKRQWNRSFIESLTWYIIQEDEFSMQGYALYTRDWFNGMYKAPYIHPDERKYGY